MKIREVNRCYQNWLSLKIRLSVLLSNWSQGDPLVTLAFSRAVLFLTPCRVSLAPWNREIGDLPPWENARVTTWSPWNYASVTKFHHASQADSAKND